MASVPTFPTFDAAEVLTAEKLNDFRAAASFYGSTPKAQLGRGASGSIATGGGFISFTTIDLDTDNMAANFGAQPDRLIVKTAGRYEIFGQVDYDDPTATGVRVLEIWKNGVRYTGQPGPAIGSGADFALNATRPLFCNVNDYIQLKFVQTSGSSTALQSQYGGSYLYMRWVNAN